EWSDDVTDSPVAGRSQNGISSVADLLELVRRKEPKKRSRFRLLLHFTDELAIGVRGYSLVLEQKKPQHVCIYTQAEQIQRVAAKTTYHTLTEEGEQREIPMAEMKYYFEYGGAQAFFTGEELKTEFKCSGEPGSILFWPRRGSCCWC